MTLITHKDLGKIFTKNDNKTHLTLKGIYLLEEKPFCKLETSIPGVYQLIEAEKFLSDYKQGTVYPPKGSICECTYTTFTGSTVTVVRYSNGKGELFEHKSLCGAPIPYNFYESVKVICKP